MTALRGLAWLLLLQTVGELLARGLSLPFPGPVVGMGLLFASLFSTAVREAVGAVAEFLLSHLSLLFVPVGVGAISYVSLLSEHGLRIAVVIVLSTWTGIVATAFVWRMLWNEEEGDAELR